MRRTIHRLLSSFRSSRAERELTREIQSHLLFRSLAGWRMDLKLGGRMRIKYPGLTVVSAPAASA